MTKIEVTVTKRKKDYKDKETGAAKTMNLVVLTLPNGTELEVASGRFNYKAFDHLSDLVDGK